MPRLEPVHDPAHKLQDLLSPGLKIVFVGTAAGTKSAEVGHYYAGPGNKFWRTLHLVGLTPREFEPSEFAHLSALGMGFTDVSKTTSGMDDKKHIFDLPRFLAAMECYRPSIIAFTGKKAASLALRKSTRQLSYGQQQAKLADAILFVLPSTSGGANGYWSETPWRELAATFQAIPKA